MTDCRDCEEYKSLRSFTDRMIDLCHEKQEKLKLCDEQELRIIGLQKVVDHKDELINKLIDERDKLKSFVFSIERRMKILEGAVTEELEKDDE